jgi:hypothetical protein
MIDSALMTLTLLASIGAGGVLSLIAILVMAIELAAED